MAHNHHLLTVGAQDLAHASGSLRLATAGAGSTDGHHRLSRLQRRRLWPHQPEVGACRQCAVKQYNDENDTRGRIVMSCMTPASDGTWISIEDEESKAFRASPQAISIATLLGGQFVDVNDSFLEMVGYEREEVIGRTLDEVIVWPEREERRAIISAIMDQGAVRNVEITFRRKSGETGVALLSAEAVELDGTPCVLTIAKDVTERIQAAQEREQLIQELDAFARTVAHDLKSPLSPILGYSELLLDEKASLTNEARRTFTQMIADNARRMGNIIDELLLLARMRQSELKTHPLDMAAIVQDALDRLAYLTMEYEAEIVVADTWPAAMGYAPWVVEVWVNYISNGLKYGGTPPRVELGADVLPDGTPRFWVRDNGAGLTAEQQALLFTPFTQLSEGHVEGHGLGLSIVQRIVERLSGTVGVESEPGQGCLFYFTLPPVPASEAV